MACSCNCSPCNCQPRPSVCCTPTVESVEYTFENANLAGIGVFDNDTDNLVQFRGIVSDSASLTVTLNAVDNTIVLTFDPAALVADIPDATTTQRGILETATNAEALAKAATDKTVTPSNFAAMASSTTFAGLVELATDAETIAGVSTTLAVTPAGLAAASVLTGTTTWADSVARNAAVPGYDGQFGTQLDSNLVYVANGTIAGSFDVPLVTLGSTANVAPSSTSITIPAAADFTFTTGGAGSRLLFDTDSELGNTRNLAIEGNLRLNTGGTFDLNGGLFSVAGVLMAANAIVGTDSFGSPAELLVANFLSSYSTQPGWGVPSGTLARTTFASYAGQTISNPPTQAEVQAIDDALVIVSRRLAALVTDIMAVNLPAA